jgi:hypothetical protein
VCVGMRARGRRLGGGPFRVGVAVRLARLADIDIGDSGVTALAAALPQMPSLTTLDLRGTRPRVRVAGSFHGGSRIGGWAAARAVGFGVRGRGWMLVGGLFRVGGAVRLARLADNQIEESGVTALAAALPQMPSLTTLVLGGTSTATRARCGFLNLGLALRWLGDSSRRRLRRAGARLDVGRSASRVGAAVRLARLAENQIGDSGVTALAAALPQMPSLTTLVLGGTATRARCGFL